jgi:hypothetical protein
MGPSSALNILPNATASSPRNAIFTAFKISNLTVSRGCLLGHVAGVRSSMAVSASFWMAQRRLLSELFLCWTGTSATELQGGEWRVRSQSYGTVERTDFSRSASGTRGMLVWFITSSYKMVTVLLHPPGYKKVAQGDINYEYTYSSYI